MNYESGTLPATIPSPFGGGAKLRQKMPTSSIVSAYKKKANVDISWCFQNLSEVGMYECARTGYKFWRPESIAGDEGFYRVLSHSWPDYYRAERWEYPLARKFLEGKASLLEIGCGKGYFLRSMEDAIENCAGLEFNQDAIQNKVARSPVYRMSIEELAGRRAESFDAVCSFQVLEHVVNPSAFIESALACLKKEGLLILSTPDNDSPTNKDQKDPFDLPPHHVGHFNSAIYQRIADNFGLTLVASIVESRARFPLSSRARSVPDLKKVLHVVKMGLKYPLSAASLVTQKPGGMILAVFQKAG